MDKAQESPQVGSDTARQSGGDVDSDLAHAAAIAAKEREQVGLENVANQIAGTTDVEKAVVDTVDYASLSGTNDTAMKVVIAGTPINLAAGSRFEASYAPDGIYFSCNPAIEIVTPHSYEPNVKLTSVKYHFATGRFEVDGEMKHDIGGGLFHFARKSAEKELHKQLMPMLPKRMQQPGYSPMTDPDIAETRAELEKNFDVGSGLPSGMGGELIDHIKNFSSELQLLLPKDINIALPDGMAATIPAGKRITLRADASGTLDNPSLKDVVIDTDGLRIGKVGSTLQSLDMKKITIKPGGVFEFDYSLAVEGMMDGIELLAGLAAVAGHQGNMNDLQPVELTEERKQINQLLNAQIAPPFRDFFAENDKLFPGYSMKKFFGI